MNKKELKEMNQLKVNTILGSVSTYGINYYSSAKEIQEDIATYANKVLKGKDNLKCKLYIDDTDDVSWKSKSHFTKVFDDEIKYCKEKYELTRNDVLFLKSLSEFLLWEINLLVDENNSPANQKTLAKLLEISPKTIQRNMKSLEEKMCVFSIPYGNEMYYLVNPFLIYKGGQINLVLPALFTEMGYVDKLSSKRDKK